MQSRTRIHADPSLNEDHFYRIPDSLVLLIFNKLADVRSLGRCSAVSNRFRSLVPLVHDVYVKIDRVVSVDGDSDGAFDLCTSKPSTLFAHFFKVMLFSILKPFHQLQNFGGRNKPLRPQLSHHSPAQVLKNFTHVRNLRIELPAAVLTDADGQGTLAMGLEQLKEFRQRPSAVSASSNRTQVPASSMKLRYAPYMELAGGIRMQGATLVAINPAGEGTSNGNSSRREAETLISGAFDGPFHAAAKALVKSRTYLLEMNGF